MKKLIVTLTAILLLTSCEPMQSSTQIGTSDTVDTTIGTSITEDISNSKISDYDISEFDFSAYFYDYYGDTTHEPTWNRYEGTIQDEDIKKQLFDLVCEYENVTPYNGGSVGGSSAALYLTNKSTGEEFTIYFSIWYASEELEGGPEVMKINGNYYSATTGDSDMFYSLIGEAIMKEENLISLGAINNQTTTSESEVNNQLTKEDRRSEIMLISQHTNWADEYVNYGYFVTIYGDVYEFDFSDYDSQEYMFPNEKTDFLSYLVDIMDNGQISRIEDVSNIPYLLPEVDANSGWKNIYYACDMGQTTLYGVRPNADSTDMEIIKLYSYGDSIDILQDANAQEICTVWLGDRFIIE